MKGIFLGIRSRRSIATYVSRVFSPLMKSVFVAWLPFKPHTSAVIIRGTIKFIKVQY